MSAPPVPIGAGHRSGRLLVLRRAGTVAKQSHWLCRCDCGREVTIAGTYLARGVTRSCGCLRTHPTRTTAKSAAAALTKALDAWR